VSWDSIERFERGGTVKPRTVIRVDEDDARILERTLKRFGDGGFGSSD
jgi:hypothetical protein